MNMNNPFQYVSRYVWVKFQKEGVHAYPAALTDPNLEDVKFLGYPHRHIFKFQVWIEVEHDDRDIEFIQFKRFLESLYDGGVLELDYRSCEMIADDLSGAIAIQYPGRDLIIEVSEDGENGCSQLYYAVKSEPSDLEEIDDEIVQTALGSSGPEASVDH